MKIFLAYRIASRLTMALALAALAVQTSAASPPRGEPPRGASSLRLSAEYSTADGSGVEARLRTDDVDLRARVAVSEAVEAGFGASVPYLRLGSTRPQGLAAFVYGPGSSTALLLGRAGAPLELDGPDGADYLGASLGEDFGLFATARLSAGELAGDSRKAAGAWLSRRGGWFSVLAMACGEPGGEGGPSWYDAPEPPSRRAFAALSAQAASAPGPGPGRAWALAAAAVGSAGFPGADAAAGRVEARASAGRFRFEAIGSAASESWVDPDGTGAPLLKLDAAVRYASRGFASTVAYRYAVTDSAVSRYAATAELATRLGFARIAASLTPAAGVAAAIAELDARFRPALAPWLTLSGSWRAVGGEATRLDAFASIRFGHSVSVALDYGARLSPDGRYDKASASIARNTARGSLTGSFQSAGWIASGDLSADSVQYSIRATATLK